MKYVINSLCDTDYYTFTQAQAILHHYPNVRVKYRFKCRNLNQTLGKLNANVIADTIKNSNWAFCRLQFHPDEIQHLRQIPEMKDNFVDRLVHFKPNERCVDIKVIDDDLYIDIEGLWFDTIWFEVPLLATISESYSDSLELPTPDMHYIKTQLRLIDHLDSGFKFVDFGTRRRFSYEYQKEVLKFTKQHYLLRLAGTSNVHFAMELDLPQKGTMSHQWFQAHQQLVKVRDHVKVALDIWAREYRGKLGIALSDIVGFDAFLRDFDLYFAKLYDGCRHDSGDPYKWGNLFINHYISLGISPMLKTGFFSDGLRFQLMADLYEYFSKKIQTGFGIGTEYTGKPWKDYIAPQIVIKMIECNGYPTAKLPDSAGKGMCEDPEFEQHIGRTFKHANYS